MRNYGGNSLKNIGRRKKKEGVVIKDKKREKEINDAEREINKEVTVAWRPWKGVQDQGQPVLENSDVTAQRVRRVVLREDSRPGYQVGQQSQL
jgi:hypothetical protein